jgi:hypothetical protein
MKMGVVAEWCRMFSTSSLKYSTNARKENRRCRIIYTKWDGDGLSQKTISRYCPFNVAVRPDRNRLKVMSKGMGLFY